MSSQALLFIINLKCDICEDCSSTHLDLWHHVNTSIDPALSCVSIRVVLRLFTILLLFQFFHNHSLMVSQKHFMWHDQSLSPKIQSWQRFTREETLPSFVLGKQLTHLNCCFITGSIFFFFFYYNAKILSLETPWQHEFCMSWDGATDVHLPAWLQLVQIRKHVWSLALVQSILQGLVFREL